MSNGWEDPARLGEPRDPDQTGWHWLQRGNDEPRPFEWSSGYRNWWLGADEDRGEGWQTAPHVGRIYRYLGPCLDHQQRSRLEKRAAGFEATLRTVLAVTERRNSATFNIITDGVRRALEEGKDG